MALGWGRECGDAGAGTEMEMGQEWIVSCSMLGFVQILDWLGREGRNDYVCIEGSRSKGGTAPLDRYGRVERAPRLLHQTAKTDICSGKWRSVSEPNARQYFVLHHYGGVCYDVEIGCEHLLDSLLTYPGFIHPSQNSKGSNKLVGT
ncbi:hypothetical protein ARMSODRAFT_999785 [Armillaria solidipes]|uniref:Uncharacterized protein n=1 Tax=Armillaria solidipes TaxID=1076256 RepID=A0A2H3CEC8_9AGAR|nr:hypothetical protein ARMSODRAFT_999785 [Armillaria solidipes]